MQFHLLLLLTEGQITMEYNPPRVCVVLPLIGLIAPSIELHKLIITLFQIVKVNQTKAGSVGFPLPGGALCLAIYS
jgi:hypothetical protein